MSVLDIKNDLLRLVVETNDADILDEVQKYFKILKKEPIAEEIIQAQEARMIELGLKQIEEGKVLSHETAKTKILDFFNKKQS